MHRPQQLPLLFIDVDGVLSTYGFDPDALSPRALHMVDGILHHVDPLMAERLLRLVERFEPVWATGWGERANEHLVSILGLPGQLDVVEFEVAPSADGSGHWKIEALDRYAAAGQPAAWIDDGHNAACQAWAEARSAPTLLITTDPAIGLTDEDVEALLAWARELGG